MGTLPAAVVAEVVAVSAEQLAVPAGVALVEQVDALARQLRRSERPRRDLADALDWYLGEWGASGLATPALAVNDHLRTLALAAAQAEAMLEQRARGPVADPWPTLPATRVQQLAHEGAVGAGRGSCGVCRGHGCRRCRFTGKAAG